MHSDQCAYRNSLDPNDRDTNYRHHNHHYIHFEQMLNFFFGILCLLILSTINSQFSSRTHYTQYSSVFAVFLFIESKFCWREFSFSSWFNSSCRLSILVMFEPFARFLGIFKLNSHTHSFWSYHYFQFEPAHPHIWWFLSFFSLLSSCILVCRSNFKVLTST